MNGRRMGASTKDKLTRLFVSQFEGYVDAVLSDSREACLAEVMMVRRHAEDLERDWRWTFSIPFAVKPLLWMAANLVFPLGGKRGKPLKLEDWQVFIVMNLFGWVDKETKRRRYIDAYLQIPRKNGKSTLAGAVIDFLAFGDMGPCANYIGANSLDQAGETFSRAAMMLSLAKHDGLTVSNSKNYKAIKWGDSFVEAIAGSPRDGKLPHGAVFDERHESKSNDLIDSLTYGTVSDPETMMIRVTTAGTNLEGVCHQEYQQCKKILEGEMLMPRYFVAIWECDHGDDEADPKTWKKANPNWGVSIDQDIFQALYEKSCFSESAMVMFRTKNLNMWVHSITRWANMPVWYERCRTTFDTDSLCAGRCYGALDLSSNSDFTAFTLDFPRNEGRHDQLTHYWVAAERVEYIARQCSIPLQDWIADGYVTATPGPVIDYAYVVDYLNSARDMYDLRLIAADRWKVTELIRIMPPWFVDTAIEFSQGIKSMSPSIKTFERHYLQGLVSDGGNPVQDWMMSCCEVFTDSSGNVKLIKPQDRSDKRIDGPITAVMALDIAITHEAERLDGADVSSIVRFF